MNKRDAMYDQIKRHGESLLELFPGATETDPVKLCKKLRRIETAISMPILRHCNIGLPENELEIAMDKALAKVKKLLGLNDINAQEIGLFINTDPRGYALKISDRFTGVYNSKIDVKRIYTDWGGYGILAPDFSS